MRSSGPDAQRRSLAGLAGLWSDFLLTLSGQAVALLLGVGGVVLATRLLGPDGYGRLALFSSAGQLLYVVGIHWSMAAAVRFGREALTREGRAGAVLGSWLAVVGASSGATVLLVVLAAPFFSRWLDSTPLGLAVLAVLLLSLAAAKVQEHLLQMASLIRTQVTGRSLGKLAFCGALGLLLLVRGSGSGLPEHAALAMAAGFVVQALSVLPLLYRGAWGVLSTERSLVLRISSYSMPFFGRSAAGYLLDWMDVYFLRLNRTTAEIGVYQVAYQWMVVTSETLGAALLLAFPLLTAKRALGEEGAAQRYAGRLLPQVAVAWGLLLPTLGLLGGVVVPWLLGPPFAMVSRLFGLLLVAASFQLVLYGALPVLASHDRAPRTIRILVVMVAVNFVGDLLLTRPLGALGTGLATAATYAAGGLLHARLLSRELGVRVGPLLLPACLTVPALAAQAMGAPLFMKATLWLACTAATLTWSRRARVFKPEDLALFEAVVMPSWVRGGLLRLYRGRGRHS